MRHAKSAEKVVQAIRRKTRRRFSPEEKIRIVLEGLRGEESIAALCPREPRGVRSPSAEKAAKVLLEAGADINVVNEADFTALHGAAFRGLNEVIEYLVEQGADINARDFRGRTPYRLAEGSKQSFQFQSWPETAELLKALGADTKLGIPGTVQERLRDAALTDTQN